MTHILCPSCTELVSAKASRCAHCSELLKDFTECPACRERVRSGARVCRHCGYRFVRTAPPPVPVLPVSSREEAAPGTQPSAAPDPVDYTVGATPLGGLLGERSLSALFAPSELRMTQEAVVLSRWSALGLRKNVERLPVARIGGVNLRPGSIWSTVQLDPVGFGPPLEIAGLRRDEARAMVELIEKAVAASRPSAPAFARTTSPGPPVSRPDLIIRG